MTAVGLRITAAGFRMTAAGLSRMVVLVDLARTSFGVLMEAAVCGGVHACGSTLGFHLAGFFFKCSSYKAISPSCLAMSHTVGSLLLSCAVGFVVFA